MAIIIKNVQQIEKMRRVSRLVKEAHDMLEGLVVGGVQTRELDMAVEKFLKKNGAIASFKNYRGYPKSICISINDEVVHGIPGARKLIDGDIVSIDIGAYLDGFHGDCARTYAVGVLSDENKRLVEVTRQSFFEGMHFAKAGCFLHQISAAIQDYVEANGFSVVRDLVGHGVGSSLHEKPEIPNFRQKTKGPRLAPGMTLAIEPMVNAGSFEVITLDDGWTVVTVDGKNSAHYENTVLITDDEPEILTI